MDLGRVVAFARAADHDDRHLGTAYGLDCFGEALLRRIPYPATAGVPYGGSLRYRGTDTVEDGRYLGRIDGGAVVADLRDRIVGIRSDHGYRWELLVERE